MTRSVFIGSVFAAIILVTVSFVFVVGYQIIQSSNQQKVYDGITQRDLLFQTIVDFANNKEIQRVILKSQISIGLLPNTDEQISLTKQQLKQMYFISLMLSKLFNKERIQTIIGKYHFHNQGIQKEISEIIEKDTALQSKIKQLSNMNCDCENKEITSEENPFLCLVLFPFYLASILFMLVFFVFGIPSYSVPYYLLDGIGRDLYCFWVGGDI